MEYIATFECKKCYVRVSQRVPVGELPILPELWSFDVCGSCVATETLPLTKCPACNSVSFRRGILADGDVLVCSEPCIGLLERKRIRSINIEADGMVNRVRSLLQN